MSDRSVSQSEWILLWHKTFSIDESVQEARRVMKTVDVIICSMGVAAVVVIVQLPLLCLLLRSFVQLDLWMRLAFLAGLLCCQKREAIDVLHTNRLRALSLSLFSPNHEHRFFLSRLSSYASTLYSRSSCLHSSRRRRRRRRRRW